MYAEFDCRDVDWPNTIASDRDRLHRAMGIQSASFHHEHRYRGGPPDKRVKAMQIGHETRARQAGVHWDMVDLRDVYDFFGGRCGICGLSVGKAEFTVDHIVPISKGGPHLFGNLQPAHLACNSRKGDRVGAPN